MRKKKSKKISFHNKKNMNILSRKTLKKEYLIISKKFLISSSPKKKKKPKKMKSMKFLKNSMAKAFASAL